MVDGEGHLPITGLLLASLRSHWVSLNADGDILAVLREPARPFGRDKDVEVARGHPPAATEALLGGIRREEVRVRGVPQVSREERCDVEEVAQLEPHMP